MALVRNDTDLDDEKMNDFEVTASYLLLHDPVSKKQTARTKRGVAKISNTSGIETYSSTAGKLAHGQTDVKLRFYKCAEYRAKQRTKGGAPRAPFESRQQEK
jgi:hypothetical protein